MSVTRLGITGGGANPAGFTFGSMPSHAAGDRLLMVLAGKYDATNIPAAPSGWTLLGSATGGTGATGIADVGMGFIAIYGIDATGTVPAPTIAWGATVPDSATAVIVSYRHTAGLAWRDAIATSAPWVLFGDDTNTASPLTATSAAFAGQPTTGDAIFVVGAVPTDTGSVSGTTTTSVTGLSGGTQTYMDYVETNAGNDSAQVGGDWVGFTGTASSGVTASLTTGGNNHSGPIAFIALREDAGPTLTDAPFAGSGALSVEAVEVEVTTAPFAGSGALSAETVEVEETTAPFAGSGALSVALESTITDAPFAGSGALSVTTVEVEVATAPFAGSGALSVEIAVEATTTAPFAGSGALSVEAAAGTDANFGGSGSLSVVTDVVYDATTNTANNVYAIMFTGDGDLVWEPAVVARPLLLANGEAQISARKIDTVTLGTEGMATLGETVVSTPRHRDRVLIGSTDWTFKDGFPIEVPDYELLEPFMYGDGGTLVLPQVNARYEKLGVGRLKRVKLGAKVVYQRVDDDPSSPTYNEVVATDYKGFILREGRRGDQLALAIGGELLGRAALKWHPVPIFRKVRDAGIQLFNSVIGMGLRYTPRMQTIGIDLVSRGGMQEDQYLLDTMTQLTTGDGGQWTVMPTATGAYTASLKDRTTVNATVYLDNEFASADLGNDLAEKSNRIWINALAPDGQRIMHASAPNLQATETPPLPLVGGFPMTIGDIDADTSTGDGVTVLVWRLTFTGLLDKDDLPGGFDADVRDAVVDFQISAGCTNIAGSVDSETWDKLWDNFETGYSVQFAAQRPAVQDDAVQKFDRSGSGNIIGRHEGYDETAIVVDLPLDMGPVGSRRQAFKMAKHKLRPVGDEDWVGTITLTSGLIAGDHTPGTPLTADMIRPNRAVRPGWNVKVPHFPAVGQSTLFHVSACQVRDKGWQVDLLVDTRARDAMEAWAVKQRNRENRYEPARYLGGKRRRSIAVQDTVTPWDKIVGQTDRDWPLAAGGWTQIPVPAGQAGTVQRTEIVLDKAHEFAAIVAERPIPLARLNRTIAPLAVPPSDPQRHHVDIAGGPTGGTFTLSGNSNTTTAIAYGASAGAVQAAVRTLGGAFATSTVTKSASSGDYTVTMPSALDLDVGTNSLTGGSPTISVTTTGPSSGPGAPWWGKPAIRSWLKKYGAQVSWGTYENPCGYDPYMKAHPQTGAPTAAVLTGEFTDDDSWGYDCGLNGAVLYLYIWVGVANTLPRQRVFHQQLDGSGT